MSSGRPDGSELRVGLWGNLEPQVQHALSHPVRRDVLRLLHGADGPRTPEAIFLAREGRSTVSQLAYHLFVLEEAGLVGRVEGRYVSIVADHAQIAVALAATVSADGAPSG